MQRLGEGEASPPSVAFASGGLSWTRVKTPRLLSRLGKACFLLGALAVLGSIATSLMWLEGLRLLSVLAWPLFIASYIVSLTQSVFPASLEVSAGELVIVMQNMRRKVIPRAQITGALVVERTMFGQQVMPTVEIELASGNVLTARLADPRGARAIVNALGFGAGGRRVHASLTKPTRRLLHPVIGAVAYIGTLFAVLGTTLLSRSEMFSIVYAAYPVITLTVYELLRRALRAPEVTVGDDGVLIKKGFRTRFLPRSEIGFVTAADGTALVIEGPAGSGLRTNVGGMLVDDARRTAIARVIEERAGPSAAGADRFLHYERGGRAIAEWREHLARSMNETTYRESAATVDEAAAVLHSAQATPEQRVGAALALRIAGQPKERIRVAVEGAVDARVREALEAVADADDDAVLEKALRRLGSL